MACPAVARIAMRLEAALLSSPALMLTLNGYSTTTMNVDEPHLAAAGDGIAQDRLRHLLCLQQVGTAHDGSPSLRPTVYPPSLT
jgi:hypothetical protein